MNPATLAKLTGRIVIRPGSSVRIDCERPLIGMLGELLRGQDVEHVATRLGAVLTLCSEVQMLTATRALQAACGVELTDAEQARDQTWLSAWTLREHLVQLGTGLPTLAPIASVGSDARWLRALPPAPSAGQTAAGQDYLRQLVRFTEHALLGCSIDHWIAAFGPPSCAAVAAWAAETADAHPAARWLSHAMARTRHLELDLHPLEPSAAEILHACADAARVPRRGSAAALWGAAVETGPFCRRAALPRACAEYSVADLLAFRLVDILQLCRSRRWLSLGAVALSDGEAFAYTEMARGLLIHWVRLTPAASGASRSVEDYRLLAPTDWNFHPEGALARCLGARALDSEALRLLVAALDPCTQVIFEPAPACGDARPEVYRA